MPACTASARRARWCTATRRSRSSPARSRRCCSAPIPCSRASSRTDSSTSTSRSGPEGAYAGALAAIDIALWDLKGKALGQPVWKLLGGAWRRELPFYASIGGNGQRTVDEVCRVVEDVAEARPAQVKIRFDADKTARDVDLAGDIAKARAVRKLVGDGFPLAFDSNNGYSVQGAIRVGRALEELGYVWFEEPVQHYHVESFAKVAAALDIAVSAGEQEYTLQGIKRLIEAGVDIVQPDIVKTGGFTGLARHGGAGPRVRRRLRAAPDTAVDRPHRQPALRGVTDPLAPPGRVQRTLARCRTSCSRRPCGRSRASSCCRTRRASGSRSTRRSWRSEPSVDLVGRPVRPGRMPAAPRPLRAGCPGGSGGSENRTHGESMTCGRSGSGAAFALSPAVVNPRTGGR